MKQIFTDQMHHKVALEEKPRRIISLVPSQTELLFDLGLEKEIVGITKFCVHPKEKCTRTTKIGGTKTLNLEKIAALQPDLIIGNKEENERSQIETLREKFPVWMSDISTIGDACAMIRAVGEMTDKAEKAEQLAAAIQQAFSKKAARIGQTAYFIWRKPLMVAGDRTFIHHLMEMAGFENVFSERQRYPEISPEELVKVQPEIILLPSEPFPFAEKHLTEFRKLCPFADVRLVDGEMFSWYGSRLLKAASYFDTLRHLLAVGY